MITSLNIRNFALIDQLHIEFDRGLSVLTGETGAGKSIILGALGLILGARADIRAIKDPEQKCVIEGGFDLSSYQLQSFFEQADLEYDESNCILRRELLASGKSRAFINDTPVSLTQLKQLGSFLIDIHSQHQNLLLGDDLYQLKVIDTLANTGELLATYSEDFQSFKQLQTELRLALARLSKGKEEADYLRFQYEQLEEANLQSGEQLALEAELEMSSNVEDIKQALFASTSILESDQGGVMSALHDAEQRIKGIVAVFPQASEFMERLHSTYVELKDLHGEMSMAQEDITYDPERHVWVQDRLDLLYRLEQKHQVDSDEALMVLRDEFLTQLEQLDHSDELISELETKIALQKEKLLELAALLTSKRKQAAKIFEVELVKKLQPLGMPHVRFEVAFSSKVNLDETGLDQLQFTFTANKNQALMPVVDIASGGEISRLMLVIKSIIASATALPTIIFDEIDTGVSGEIAEKMGDIMQQMSQFMQVMTISHLPQVASKGDQHYKVYKVDTAEATQTQIIRLSQEERVAEIARMLTGAKMTAEAISNAKALLGL